MPDTTVTRRDVLRSCGAAGALLGMPSLLQAAEPAIPRRAIPASGEEIPVIGLGTSDEFESLTPETKAELMEVLRVLVALGGRLVDTAPGYGDAELVLGRLARELGLTGTVFWSTKVRAEGRAEGLAQMARSLERLGKQPLDLMMVHSLYDLATQWPSLRALEDEKKVRYIGVTHSRTAAFPELEAFMRAERPDFVQLNFSPMEPEAEERLLPLAAERGIAVMVNRPFGNGELFRLTRGRPLPDWAVELGCESWAQLSLKYILGAPAVTCVIPATSNPRHMRDNLRAALGRLPDAPTRARMRELVASL